MQCNGPDHAHRMRIARTTPAREGTKVVRGLLTTCTGSKPTHRADARISPQGAD